MERTRANIELGLESGVILLCAFSTFTFICFFGFVFWYINTEDKQATGEAKEWKDFATSTLRYFGAVPLIALLFISLVQAKRQLRK